MSLSLPSGFYLSPSTASLFPFFSFPVSPPGKSQPTPRPSSSFAASLFIWNQFHALCHLVATTHQVDESARAVDLAMLAISASAAENRF